MDVLTCLHCHCRSRLSRSLSIQVSDGREERGGGEEGGEDSRRGLSCWSLRSLSLRTIGLCGHRSCVGGMGEG